MTDKKTIEQLRSSVCEYRKQVLELCYKAKGLHIGGDLSCAEAIITLFQHTMHIDPSNPADPDRDRFVLSKGHGSAALYLAMAQRGYFPTEDVMNTYKGFETHYGAHPCKAACPQLDSSSGSLGHGLSIATGMALAARLDKKSYRVFCMIGDGEAAEGEIWEAALEAPNLKLGNLIAVMDRNYMGLDGFTEEILPLEPMADKWRAFNWSVVCIDGNDIKQVVEAFDALPPAESDKPTMILCNTVKGKGVSFIENNPLFHHRKLDEAELKQALDEVEQAYLKAKGE